MAKIQDVLARNEELAEQVIGPASDDIDRLRQFPRKNIEALGQAGVLGLMVPAQYEGLNGGLTELVQSLEVLARRCPSTAMVVLMHYCATAVITAKRQRIVETKCTARHRARKAPLDAGV